MQKDIGVGVIGLGLGATLLPLNRDPETRLVVRGACSARPASLAKETLDPWDVAFYTNDYRELARRDDIRIVGVFSPDELHYEQCLAAIEAGKHVICTKPLATRSDHALHLVRAARERGLRLMVGQTFRFEEQCRALRGLVDEGRLGRIIYAEAAYIHDMRSMYLATPWRLQKKWMIGAGCHPLDSLLWFLGDIEEVHAYASRGGLSEYADDDNFVVNLRCAGGVIARATLLMGCAHSPEPMMRLSLYGERGTATAAHTDNEAGTLEYILDDAGSRGPNHRLTFPATGASTATVTRGRSSAA